MARRKKTWVERTNYTYLDDDCDLPDYLVFAAYQTCKRFGWDMSVTRQSETFRKIETWLPTESGFSSICGVDVIVDVKNPKQLYRRSAVDGSLPLAFNKAGRQEAQAFMDALDLEIKHMLQEWRLKTSPASPTGLDRSSPQPIEPDSGTDINGEGTNREIENLDPWERIPDYLWDRDAIKMWCAGHTNVEIGDAVSVSPKRVTNRISELRKSYPFIPTNEERRKTIIRKTRDIE